jgi:hypothetical protein
VSELQDMVASAADSAGAHSTAPTLLLQAMAAVGQLASTTDRATEAGRRPFRIPHDWADQLSELAWLVYLLADQTGVELDTSIRLVATRVTQQAAADRARVAANRNDESWF